MDDRGLALLSLEDLASEIAAKRVSPVEVTEVMLRRIESIDPRLNSYLTVTAESALAKARTAESEIAAGRYRGTLHGVPIAIKDLFATKGVRTTMGSAILRDWVPDYDAAVVEKLHDAGAVSLGKLGMHEWAYGTTSDNLHFGPIRNPWNTDHVPGGSSGGSGAATAAGLAYATLGSDTGGSIRMPAAACGCVGLMPTYGRVSLYGALPLSWTLDHAGPLTRTVRDAAIVLQAIAGRDPRDPATSSGHAAVPDYLEGIDAGAKGLRIGVPRYFFWDNLEAGVEKSVRGAIAALEAAGAEVHPIDMLASAVYPQAIGPIMFADAAAYHAKYYPARRDEYSPQVAALLELGLKITGPQLAAAMRVLTEARAGGADALLEGVDVLAVPTMPIVAPSIEASRAADPSGRMSALTTMWDLTGQPVVAVPAGLTDEGMPASISFVARRWDERAALRAARAHEMVRGPMPAPPVS